MAVYEDMGGGERVNWLDICVLGMCRPSCQADDGPASSPTRPHSHSISSHQCHSCVKTRAEHNETVVGNESCHFGSNTKSLDCVC